MEEAPLVRRLPALWPSRARTERNDRGSREFPSAVTSRSQRSAGRLVVEVRCLQFLCIMGYLKLRLQFLSTHISNRRRCNLISVVVSCSGRKSLPVPKSNRLGTIRRGKGPSVDVWIDRLQAKPRTRSALDLYQGEHWSVCRELACKVQLVVASAGYGLIRPETLLAPYSATFGMGHPDSVVADQVSSLQVQRQHWWSALQRWNGPEGVRITLPTLARQGPVIVAMSFPYISALETEILLAENASPGQVMIVSTGGVTSGLQAIQLPGDGRLQNVFGGSLQALNVRTARSVVECVGEAGLDLPTAAQHLESLLATAGHLKRFDRKRLDDAEVQAFIRSAFASNPRVACSPTLRGLRDQGMACEQARFKTLFEDVRSSL